MLRTNRVAGLIEVIDQGRLVKDLSPIEKLLLEGGELVTHDFIAEGTKCKVIAGPLMGTEGVVIRSGEKTRLVLQVEMLGQATSVEISREMIEVED